MSATKTSFQKHLDTLSDAEREEYERSPTEWQNSYFDAVEDAAKWAEYQQWADRLDDAQAEAAYQESLLHPAAEMTAEEIESLPF